MDHIITYYHKTKQSGIADPLPFIIGSMGKETTPPPNNRR